MGRGKGRRSGRRVDGGVEGRGDPWGGERGREDVMFSLCHHVTIPHPDNGIAPLCLYNHANCTATPSSSYRPHSPHLSASCVLPPFFPPPLPPCSTCRYTTRWTSSRLTTRSIAVPLRPSSWTGSCRSLTCRPRCVGQRRGALRRVRRFSCTLSRQMQMQA